MTLNDGFERTVSDWLDEQAGRGSPGYLDETLARTTRTRQRPAWSSLERWLPVQSTAHFALAPRLVWLLAVIGLIVALGATAIFVGSRRPAPSPFGESSRGTVLYGAADGDIYALDTATNLATPLVVGETLDTDPTFAPDGTKFVFTRRLPGGSTTSLMVADADGSDVRTLVGGLADASALEWSPTSDRLVLIGAVEGTGGLWVVGLDDRNTLVRSERLGAMDGLLTEPHWLPNGEELTFLAGPIDTGALMVGMYGIGADGTGERTLVAPTVQSPAQSAVSPDGSRVVYVVTTPDGPRLRVVDVATAVDSVISFDGAIGRRPQWSPDGRRLVFERDTGGVYQLAVGSVDGGAVVGIGPEQRANAGGSHARFSPDGTKVLAYYESDGSSWVLDPVDGTAVQLPDEIDSPLTWQPGPS